MLNLISLFSVKPDGALSQNGKIPFGIIYILDSDKSDGLLFLIRRQLCPAESISFAAIHPCRVGHLRLHVQTRSFDVIGCYQHVDNHSSDRSALHQAFWNELEYTCQLANRNTVLFVGDFNCCLTASSPHVGTSYHTWNNQHRKGAQHKDVDRMPKPPQRISLTWPHLDLIT